MKFTAYWKEVLSLFDFNGVTVEDEMVEFYKAKVKGYWLRGIGVEECVERILDDL